MQVDLKEALLVLLLAMRDGELAHVERLALYIVRVVPCSGGHGERVSLLGRLQLRSVSVQRLSADGVVHARGFQSVEGFELGGSELAAMQQDLAPPCGLAVLQSGGLRGGNPEIGEVLRRACCVLRIKQRGESRLFFRGVELRRNGGKLQDCVAIGGLSTLLPSGHQLRPPLTICDVSDSLLLNLPHNHGRR